MTTFKRATSRPIQGPHVASGRESVGSRRRPPVRAHVHLWATSLADAFLSGDWDEPGLRASGRTLFLTKRPPRWVLPLIRRILRTWPDPPFLQRRALVEEIGGRPELAVWFLRRQHDGIVLSPLVPFRAEQPRWDVPLLPTRGDLARWLGLEPSALDWLADRRNLLRERTEEALHHYRWRWIPRPPADGACSRPRSRCSAGSSGGSCTRSSIGCRRTTRSTGSARGGAC